MRAIVLEHPGPPEVLEIRSIPRPEPRPGWVLIQVKAFGLNRSELFTRQGYSPSVTFPRVLGIECVGVVQAAPGTNLQVGQIVAAVIGGMGRQHEDEQNDNKHATTPDGPAEVETAEQWPRYGERGLLRHVGRSNSHVR